MKTIYGIICIICTLVLFISCKKEERHVIVIGSDGFSAEVIKKNKGAFPNIEAMMAEGSYTLQRRSVLPSSSAANWASTFMGASPEIHGYTTWGSTKPDLPPREIGKYGRFPGIFGLVREQNPEAQTGFFYNWKTMECLFDQGSENRKKQGSDAEIHAAVLQFFKDAAPDLSVIVYAQPDGIGHSAGWGSPEYIEQCKIIDSYVGEIRNTVAHSPLAKSTYILFIADHGGIGKNHGGKTMSEMESPMIITGPGIKKNYNIPESTMVYDTAAIIADILKLKQPQVWIGRPIKSIYQ